MLVKCFTLFLILSTISGTASTLCFTCSDALSLRECTSIETCSEGEKCGRFAEIQNSSEVTLQKMNADKTSYCYEYCSTNKCNKDICTHPPMHGGWSSWDEWGTCSATCDTGMRRRIRSCTNPRPERFGNHCFGNNDEAELCNNGPCTNVVKPKKVAPTAP